VAVDGSCIEDVWAQLDHAPDSATDIVLSIGGNDLLAVSDVLAEVRGPGDLQRLIAEPLASIARDYAALLDQVTRMRPRLTLATVYTAIPFPDSVFLKHAGEAIAAYNEIVLREAETRGLDVLRIDLACTDPADYSEMSPIEPSAQGGQKIVDAMLGVLKAA
jgi:hypothetical protein